MIAVPSTEDIIRSEEWLVANKDKQIYWDFAARECATHLGFWEEDIGDNNEVKLFTPIWLRNLAQSIYEGSK